MSGRSTMSEMFGKTYIVKVLDDGECITEGELIRCKECKWYYRGGATCMFWDGENGMSGDNYCGKAERKEHETD